MAKPAAKKSPKPAGAGRKTPRRAGRALAKMEQLHEKATLLHQQSDSLHNASDYLHKKAHGISKLGAKRSGGVRLGKLPPRGPASERIAARERLSAAAPSPDLGAAPQSALPFSVVGIGASAGGFEAIIQLIADMPPDLGFAIVIVQHLDPNHESRLRDLIAHRAKLPAIQIRNNLAVEPNKIYVLPPNATVLLEGRRFKLGPREPRPCPMPIDFFFRSLANEQQNRAIGIVLSGSGSDGTLGLEEIKGHGGITFAQDKGTAKHFGMPGSAIAAGVVDFVMHPEEIARELKQLAHHPYIREGDGQGRRPGAREPLPADRIFKEQGETMKAIFALLRARSGVDFSLYKPGTLNRRIMRRMAMHKIETLPDYLEKLHDHAGEAEALFNDLLISVTAFFRDPRSFAALRKRILPKILKNRRDDSPIRIWTCGCATGEEAYSLAIVVAEFLEESRKHLPVQIFASDLNERGIEKARTGLYHENILLDVSPERLRRFFVKVNGHYQVNKTLRDMCVFARQNVVVDPPFSNVDLISCRNVLIYLTPVLQRRIMPVFHYALKPGGFLILGNSETIGDSSELFEPMDKKHRIYVKKLTAFHPTVDLDRAFSPPREVFPPPRAARPERAESIEATLQQRVDRFILNEASPNAVVINAQMDVLQFRGRTGPYLEHQSGAASLNLLKMAREDLALDLRRTVNKAIQTGHRASITTELRVHGRDRGLRIDVHPLPQLIESERFFLVLFHELAAGAGAQRDLPRGKSKSMRQNPDLSQMTRLRDELAATRESLQAIIEEQDATNEELKSANEEIQSSNEELQSTNEELETAREELQSTNEELTTLNQELQTRNNELGDLNNDLTNLLASVNIAIIMLGTDYKIRRFTPTAEKMFNLIPSDLGRRLSDLNRNIVMPDLEDVIQDVIQNLNVIEREVQDREGRWYSLRIRPYRTREGRIDGVVLILLDIDELKRAIRHIISLGREPLIALTADLKITRVNDAFCRAFGVLPEQAEGKSIYEMGEGDWNLPRLKQLLEEILPTQGEVRDFRLEHEFKALGKRTLMLNARRFYEETRGLQLIMLAIEDATS